MTYACPVCGEPVEMMRLPRSWSADEVAKWRRHEARLPCASCDGVPWPDIDD